MTEKETNCGAIWNPNAAVNWSLLFSPLFGSYIHALNWRTLGEEGRAKTEMIWFYVMLAIIILTSIMAMRTLDTVTVASSSFFLLFLWYFFSGRRQAKYVNEKLGADYARCSWNKPLGIAAMVFSGSVLLNFFLMFSPEKMVHEGTLESCPNVTVGQMADSFLEDPLWMSDVSSTHQTFVNLTGKMFYDGKEVQALIQFFISKDQKSFQYNALEFDGVAQTHDLATVLFTKMCESATGGTPVVPPPPIKKPQISLITAPVDGYKDLKFGESAKVIMEKLEKVCNLEGNLSKIVCKATPGLGLPGLKIFGQARVTMLMFLPSEETSNQSDSENVKLSGVFFNMGTFNQQEVTTLITELNNKYSIFKKSSKEENDKFDSELSNMVDIVQYAKGSVVLTFSRNNGNIDMYLKYMDVSRLKKALDTRKEIAMVATAISFAKLSLTDSFSMNGTWPTTMELEDKYNASLVLHDSIVNEKGLGYVTITMKENVPEGIRGKSIALHFNTETYKWTCDLSEIEPVKRMGKQYIVSLCKNL
ncbi:MAG: pilin [Thiomargarita sp.]|nr:pilin [Thiomargarita sp.]